MKKIAIVLFCCVGLSACKVELSPTVNLSDVNSETEKTVQSKLIVEVMACSDYQDSKKESSDVIKTKELITNVFSDAKYVECYREKMDSKALFEIPITVGGTKPSADIQIMNAPFGGGMMVTMSKSLKQKIDNASKSAMANLSPSVLITMKNDLDQDKKVVMHSVYLDKKPVLLAPYTLAAGKSHTFKLSDVSVSSALDNGDTLVYEDSDKRMPISE